MILDVTCPIHAWRPTQGRTYTRDALYEVINKTNRAARDRRLFAQLERRECHRHGVYLSDVAAVVLYAEMDRDRVVCSLDFIETEVAKVALSLLQQEAAHLYPGILIFGRSGNLISRDDVYDGFLICWNIRRPEDQ